jgi:uroporphyrinogen decarboxylase
MNAGSRDNGGRVCFVCPVSYQTTAISGTTEEIYADVQTLVDHLGSHNGGLIGYVEEYSSIGMSRENCLACIRAFRELGRYRQGGRTAFSRRPPKGSCP